MASGGGEMKRIKLGSQGLEVSVLGLGCMGMTAFYGPPKPEEDMIALIRHAIDSGVTHFDTSDVYGPHSNELLLGKALKGGYRERATLGSKFGLKMGNGAMKRIVVCGEPSYVRLCCEESLKRLQVESIDLYYIHRIDTSIPIEITMVELKNLVKEGKIKYVGLSEACSSTIRRAHAVHPISAVQLEWSLWSRDAEREIIPTCRELGIGIVAYCPLGSGFFSCGSKLVDGFMEGDFRKTFPKLSAENLEENSRMYERVKEIAEKKGCSTSQLALAWLLHQGDDVCPIPGTTQIVHFDENVRAASVDLKFEEIRELESLAAAVKGDRYQPEFLYLTHHNSETPPLSSWTSAT